MRKVNLISELYIILSDTVGFISDLPTQLITSFKTTLEEINFSNYIIHVIDISNSDWENQREIVINTLKNILKEHLSSDRIDKLNKGVEIDFSISLSGLSRFRVNFFMQRGNIVAAFRRLPYQIPQIDSLGLPEAVINLSKAKKGLILIIGATGSGKSTTMAALIQNISNNSYGNYIIHISGFWIIKKCIYFQ